MNDSEKMAPGEVTRIPKLGKKQCRLKLSNFTNVSVNKSL